LKTILEIGEAARETGVRIRVGLKDDAVGDPDTLFHAPLLALSLLFIAYARRGSFRTSELATWTGAVLAQAFPGLKSASRQVELSMPLRRRCVDALVLLESMELLSVWDSADGMSRTLDATAVGRRFVKSCLDDEGEIGKLSVELMRANAIVAGRGIRLL
jgi:hypothetical protein